MKLLYPCQVQGCVARFDPSLPDIPTGDNTRYTGWVYPWDTEVDADVASLNHMHVMGDPIEVED